MSAPSAPAPLDADGDQVLAAERRARRLLESGAAMREVLAPLTSAVESVGGGRTVASILRIDREGLLRNAASPNLPGDYLDAIDRLRPAADVGTCAAAAATGEIVLTPSFKADARWSELRHLPMSLGFEGAWSMPIKDAAGRVVGTFGTYFREQREPTAAEREAVARLMPLAAEAIARGG